MNIEALSNEETAALFPLREGESLEEYLARDEPDPAPLALPLVPADSEMDAAAAAAIVSRIEQLEQEPEASNWKPLTQHEVLMLLKHRDHARPACGKSGAGPRKLRLSRRTEPSARQAEEARR